VPLKPCKAEDSYILFKVIELKQRVALSEECFVETERTKSPRSEEEYKRKTVCGIYQALSYTNPSISIKLFYAILPFMSPFLLFLGASGYFWMKGILLGLNDYLKGDRKGIWHTNYMK
jgi:hypothetical protein